MHKFSRGLCKCEKPVELTLHRIHTQEPLRAASPIQNGFFSRRAPALMRGDRTPAKKLAALGMTMVEL